MWLRSWTRGGRRGRSSAGVVLLLREKDMLRLSNAGTIVLEYRGSNGAFSESDARGSRRSCVHGNAGASESGVGRQHRDAPPQHTDTDDTPLNSTNTTSTSSDMTHVAGSHADSSNRVAVGSRSSGTQGHECCGCRWRLLGRKASSRCEVYMRIHGSTLTRLSVCSLSRGPYAGASPPNEFFRCLLGLKMFS